MGGTEVLTPGSLPELQAALGRATPNSRVLAGGTDLVIAMHENRCKPDLVIDLWGVKELTFVKLERGHIHIGATSTFTRLKEDELVGKYALCLAEAAAGIGSNQIRNSATIGGNIGNASPAGDTLPALMALGAVIRVLDSTGHIEEKTVDEIVMGPGKTSLKCDQVITEVVFPVPGASYLSTFVKVGSRSTVTIAKLNMALAVKYDSGSNTIWDVRLGLGAIGAKAFRDFRVESILNGQKADEKLARVLGEELCETVQRAIPGRYSLPYKKEAIKGLARDAWRNLFRS